MGLRSVVKDVPVAGEVVTTGLSILKDPFSGMYEGLSLRRRLGILKKKLIQKMYGYPTIVAFEPISRCILDCEFCMLKTLETYAHRRKTTMDFDEFKKIIDDIAFFTTNLQFSGGEPLLNKDIFRMFRYAREKNIHTMLFSNAQLIGYKDNLQRLLDDPPDGVLLAYESIDKETYETIRKKGKHDVLVNNIRMLIEEKKKRKQRFPVVTLQMVLTKKNLHQIDLFWKSARAFGADYGSVKALGVWPEGTPEYEKKMIEEYIVSKDESPISRNEFDENGNMIYPRRPGQCPAAEITYIGSGGEILPCWYILAKMEPVGNAVDENLAEVWRGEKYTALRYKMLNDWAHPLCHKCPIGAVADRRKL
jgi:radical SAM protein with 4Fe4S-binding SPASM domain